MANNINNIIREFDIDKGYFNLTMEDLPDRTVDNPIDLLLRAGDGTDLSKLLFFVRSPGLIGGDEYLQWSSDADPIAIEALEYYRNHHQDRKWTATINHTSSDNTQRNINMTILAECYGEVLQGDSTYFILATWSVCTSSYRLWIGELRVV